MVIASPSASASSAASANAVDLAALIDGVRAGQQAALGDLYDATVTRVYTVALRLLRIPADAEEVTCDTYTQVWSSAGRYDPARGNVLAWLLMICRSRALDRLRQRKAQEVTTGDEALAEVPDEAPHPDELVGQLQEGSRVRAALAVLSPERRRLVGLAFLNGLSHEEIATATGLPLGTVKSHIRRALAQLRAALG